MSAAPKVRAMRRAGSGRAQPTRTTKKQSRTTARLVPTVNSLPLVDLGLGAAVAIRFPVTGPVVDILSVRGVPAAWVSELLAPVVAGMLSRQCDGRRTTRSPQQLRVR